MTKKATLEHIRDLLMPGNAWFNMKHGTNHDIIIDKKNKKLMLSDGRVFLDDKKCKTREDQAKQYNVLHKRRLEGEK
jgi:hypothetical protein